MNLKINDAVSVLDEDLKGTITKIIGDNIIIETTEGFELEFSAKELIKIDSDTSLRTDTFSNVSMFPDGHLIVNSEIVLASPKPICTFRLFWQLYPD